MRLKKLLATTLASLMAVSTMVMPSSAAEGDIPENYAFIGFGNGDWTYGFWNKPNDGITNYNDFAKTAEITGNGEYTVSIDLSKAAAKNADGETSEFEGVGAMALVANMKNDNLAMSIKSIKINGAAVELQGVGFTKNEDGIRRVNIYNEWGAYDEGKVESDKIIVDGDASKASSTLVDKALLEKWSSMEITFEVSGLDTASDDNATEDDESDDKTTESGDNKGGSDNASTGIESVAAVAAVALIAGGIVVGSRKRK